ncbi:MAG: hypothetical protein ACFB6R_09755 [Alphaproteobacteria bacterium]
MSLSLLVLAPLVLASALTTAETPEACLKEFETGTDPMVVCSLSYRLPEKDQSKLQTISANVLQDAQCAVALSVDRASFFEGLLADRLDLTPQPVACQVQTSGDPLDVRFRVAPLIQFEDGRASAAEVRMTDLAGLPSILSNLMVTFVNSNASLERAILKAINGFLDNQEARAGGSGSDPAPLE